MFFCFVFFFNQDGLWLVSQQPSVIQGYQKGILTPNFMEFTRLYESLVSYDQFKINSVSITWKQIVCFKHRISVFYVCVFFPLICHSTTSPWTAPITSEMQCSSVQQWETLPWSWKESGISLRTAVKVHIEFGWFTWAEILSQNWKATNMAVMHSVCSDLVQCWGQREKVRWAGRPSVWISGSFGTLGPFCLCSRHAEEVKLDELKVDFCMSSFQWSGMRVRMEGRRSSSD